MTSGYTKEATREFFEKHRYVNSYVNILILLCSFYAGILASRKKM